MNNRFEEIIKTLQKWRDEDNEDAIMIGRSDIIYILEGIKATRCKCPPSPIEVTDTDVGC